jgi:hypothetical protein
MAGIREQGLAMRGQELMSQQSEYSGVGETFVLRWSWNV